MTVPGTEWCIPLLRPNLLNVYPFSKSMNYNCAVGYQAKYDMNMHDILLWGKYNNIMYLWLVKRLGHFCAMSKKLLLD